MLYLIKSREDLEKLEELNLLQNQVKAVRLQDKLGKQNSHEDFKNVFEPGTDTIKKTCENLTQTLTETFFENNEAIESIWFDVSSV